jgi:hypothetical protein
MWHYLASKGRCVRRGFRIISHYYHVVLTGAQGLLNHPVSSVSHFRTAVLKQKLTVTVWSFFFYFIYHLRVPVYIPSNNFRSIGWIVINLVVHVDGVRLCLWTAAAVPRVICEYGEPRWNDVDRGNRGTQREICRGASLSATNPTWNDLGANPVLRCERLATNRLSQSLNLVCTPCHSTLTHLL